MVGGRNSAVEAALDLYRNGAKVTLVHRGEQVSPGVKYWILPDLENRLKAGQITARFRTAVREIRDEAVVVDGPEGAGEIPTDFTFVLIGFLPDAEFLRAQQIPLDPRSLAPLHDPETMETPVRGLYVAGSVAAGRETNKIFVENGRLHGAKIVRAILNSAPRGAVKRASGAIFPSRTGSGHTTDGSSSRSRSGRSMETPECGGSRLDHRRTSAGPYLPPPRSRTPWRRDPLSPPRSDPRTGSKGYGPDGRSTPPRSLSTA